MSATPARDVLSVSDDGMTCEVGSSGFPIETVPVSSLKRPELLRAAKVRFPDSNGKAWFSITAVALVDAIQTGTLPVGFDQRTNKYAGKCATCGVGVDPGDGFIQPPVAPSTKWSTYCPEHAPGAKVPGEAPKLPREDGKAKVTVGEATKAPTEGPRPVKVTGGAPDAFTALVESIVSGMVLPTPGVDEGTVRRVVAEILDAQPARRVEVQYRAVVTPLPDAHHPVLPEIATILGAGIRNVFLVGPAGSGKSTIGEQAAAALGLEWSSISFGPTTPTSKLFGYCDANGNYVRTPFRNAYQYGRVFIGDELDNGHPGLIAEMNQALANGYGAFADQVVEMHEDFRMVATGNTWGLGPDRLFVGRNILDAATLDRFTQVEVPTDERLETALALSYVPEDGTGRPEVTTWVKRVQAVRKQVEKHRLPRVVSQRASIDGARLILAGLTPERVAEIRLFAGWSSEHREKVTA